MWHVAHIEVWGSTERPNWTLSEKMSRSVNLLLVLIVALSAVQSYVVREKDDAKMFRENRALTTTVTITAATASTTTIS